MKNFLITCITFFLMFGCENTETETMPDFLAKMDIITFEQKSVNFKNTLERVKIQPFEYVGYLDGKPYLDIRNLDKTSFTARMNLVPLYSVNNMRTAEELLPKLDEIGVSSGVKKIYSDILNISDNIESYSLNQTKSKFKTLILESKKLEEFEEIAVTYQIESMLLVIEEIEDMVNEIKTDNCVDMNKVVRDGVISGFISGIFTATQGAVAGVYAAPPNPVLGGVVGGLIGLAIGWEGGFWSGGVASIISQTIDCNEKPKVDGAQFCLDQFCKGQALISKKISYPEIAVKTKTGEILFITDAAALNLQ